MEVEVKLRLPSAEAHARVAQILAPNQEATYFQENVFFDGSKNELSKRLVVLRIRFYNGDEKCVLTVKGKAVLTDGIGRATEEEEEIEPALGRACVSDPSLLLHLNSPLLSSLRQRVGYEGLVCVGSFKNIRQVFGWQGHKLELDETQFSFGTQYEIECESRDAERLKKELERFLVSNCIPYAYATATKFATFRAGKFLD